MRPPRKPRYVSKPTQADRLIPPTAPTPEVADEPEETTKSRTVTWDRLSQLWKKRPHRDEPAAQVDQTSRKESSTPLSLQARREQLAALKRSKMLKRGIIGGAAVMLLALVGWVLFFSPLFAVKADKLEVTITDPAGVIDPAVVHQISQQAVDTPILRVNTTDISDQLRQNPEISSASVATSFPHSMTVTVTAVDPVACIGSADACTAVDRDGHELARISDEARAVLPVISMTLNEDTRHRVSGLLDALAALPDQVRASVQEASISDSGLIEFTTDTTTVKWGDASNNETKAQVLAALLQTCASTIDVTVPTAPVTY